MKKGFEQKTTFRKRKQEQEQKMKEDNTMGKDYFVKGYW